MDKSGSGRRRQKSDEELLLDPSQTEAGDTTGTAGDTTGTGDTSASLSQLLASSASASNTTLPLRRSLLVELNESATPSTSKRDDEEQLLPGDEDEELEKAVDFNRTSPPIVSAVSADRARSTGFSSLSLSEEPDAQAAAAVSVSAIADKSPSLLLSASKAKGNTANSRKWEALITNEALSYELKVEVARCSKASNSEEEFKKIGTEEDEIISQSHNRQKVKSEIASERQRGNSLEEIERFLKLSDKPNGFEKTKIIKAFEHLIYEEGLSDFVSAGKLYNRKKTLESSTKRLSATEQQDLDRFKKSRVMHIFAKLDENADGKIEYDEIISYLSNHAVPVDNTGLSAFITKIKKIKNNLAKLTFRDAALKELSTLFTSRDVTIFHPVETAPRRPAFSGAGSASRAASAKTPPTTSTSVGSSVHASAQESSVFSTGGLATRSSRPNTPAQGFFGPVTPAGQVVAVIADVKSTTPGKRTVSTVVDVGAVRDASYAKRVEENLNQQIGLYLQKDGIKGLGEESAIVKALQDAQKLKITQGDSTITLDARAIENTQAKWEAIKSAQAALEKHTVRKDPADTQKLAENELVIEELAEQVAGLRSQLTLAQQEASQERSARQQLETLNSQLSARRDALATEVGSLNQRIGAAETAQRQAEQDLIQKQQEFQQERTRLESELAQTRQKLAQSNQPITGLEQFIDDIEIKLKALIISAIRKEAELLQQDLSALTLDSSQSLNVLAALMNSGFKTPDVEASENPLQTKVKLYNAVIAAIKTKVDGFAALGQSQDTSLQQQILLLQKQVFDAQQNQGLLAKFNSKTHKKLLSLEKSLMDLLGIKEEMLGSSSNANSPARVQQSVGVSAIPVQETVDVSSESSSAAGKSSDDSSSPKDVNQSLFNVNTADASSSEEAVPQPVNQTINQAVSIIFADIDDSDPLIFSKKLDEYILEQAARATAGGNVVVETKQSSTSSESKSAEDPYSLVARINVIEKLVPYIQKQIALSEKKNTPPLKSAGSDQQLPMASSLVKQDSSEGTKRLEEQVLQMTRSIIGRGDQQIPVVESASDSDKSNPTPFERKFQQLLDGILHEYQKAVLTHVAQDLSLAAAQHSQNQTLRAQLDETIVNQDLNEEWFATHLASLEQQLIFLLQKIYPDPARPQFINSELGYQYIRHNFLNEDIASIAKKPTIEQRFENIRQVQRNLVGLLPSHQPLVLQQEIEELRRQLSDLEGKYQQLQAQKEAADQENASLRSQLLSATSDLQATEAAIKRQLQELALRESERDQALLQVQTSEAARAAMQRERDQKDAERQAVQGRLDVLAPQLATLQADNARLVAQEAAAQQALTALQAATAQDKLDWGRERGQLTTERETARSDLAALNAAVASERTTWGHERTRLEGEKAGLQTQNAALIRERDDTRSDLAALRATVKAQEAAVAAERAAWGQERTRLEGDKRTLEAQVATDQTTIRDLQLRIAALEAEIRRRDDTIRLHEATIADLRTQLAAALADTASLRTSSAAEIATLRSQLSTAQVELAREVAAKEAANQLKDRLEADLLHERAEFARRETALSEQIREQARDFGRERDDLNAELRRKQEAVTVLECEILGLRSALSAAAIAHGSNPVDEERMIAAIEEQLAEIFDDGFYHPQVAQAFAQAHNGMQIRNPADIGAFPHGDFDPPIKPCGKLLHNLLNQVWNPGEPSLEDRQGIINLAIEYLDKLHKQLALDAQRAPAEAGDRARAPADAMPLFNPAAAIPIDFDPYSLIFSQLHDLEDRLRRLRQPQARTAGAAPVAATNEADLSAIELDTAKTLIRMGIGFTDPKSKRQEIENNAYQKLAFTLDGNIWHGKPSYEDREKVIQQALKAIRKEAENKKARGEDVRHFEWPEFDTSSRFGEYDSADESVASANLSQLLDQKKKKADLVRPKKPQSKPKSIPIADSDHEDDSGLDAPRAAGRNSTFGRNYDVILEATKLIFPGQKISNENQQHVIRSFARACNKILGFVAENIGHHGNNIDDFKAAIFDHIKNEKIAVNRNDLRLSKARIRELEALNDNILDSDEKAAFLAVCNIADDKNNASSVFNGKNLVMSNIVLETAFDYFADHFREMPDAISNAGEKVALSRSYSKQASVNELVHQIKSSIDVINQIDHPSGRIAPVSLRSMGSSTRVRGE